MTKRSRRLFIYLVGARSISALNEVLREVISGMRVAVANECLAGRLRDVPRERPIAERSPEVDYVTEQRIGPGPGLFERNRSVHRQLDGVERFDVGGRRGNRLSATGLDQSAAKLFTPAGDMSHEQRRRPSGRIIGLVRRLDNELPLGLPFCLEQAKDILHRTVSSASVKEAIPSPYSAGSAEPRVSSLELFFDLVFVFTITLTPLAQLASLFVILVVGAIVDAAVTNRHAIR